MPNFLCANCGRTLDAPPRTEGMWAACPACRTRVQVPIDPAAPLAWPPRRLGTPPRADAVRPVDTIKVEAPPAADSAAKFDDQVVIHELAEVGTSPKVDEAAIAAAAQTATDDSHAIGFWIALSGIVALITAGLLHYRGVDVSSAWIAGLLASAFVGFCLFANYWFTRDRAFEEALAAERSRALVPASEHGGWSTATTVSLVMMVLVGIRSFTGAAGLRGRAPKGPDVLIAVIAIVVVFVGLRVVWYAGRRHGAVRAVSIAYILISLGTAALGYKFALPEHIAPIARVPNRQQAAAPAKSAKELAEIEKAAADARVAKLCVAPQNLGAVETMIKNHGRDKVAFIMIEAAGLTAQQRSPMWDELRDDLDGYVAGHSTPDRRFEEAVTAPAADLDALAKRLTRFKLVEIDKPRQRIVVRPDLAYFQDLAERDDAELQMRELTVAYNSRLNIIEEMRQRFGRDDIVIVRIRHPEVGLGSDRHAVYRRLKTCGQVLTIVNNYTGNTLYYFIKHPGDFSKFVERLDLGRVVVVEPPTRTVTIDLASTAGEERLGDGTVVLTPNLIGVERADLHDRYGAARVVLVQARDMPDDPEEREFACKLIRDGRESFRAFQPRYEIGFFLVAPVDDVDAYKRKLDFQSDKSEPKHEAEIAIRITRHQVQQKMRAAASADVRRSLEQEMPQRVARPAGQPQSMGASGPVNESAVPAAALADFQSRYGVEKVVRVVVKNMPDDEESKKFVRDTIRGKHAGFRVFTADDKSEHYLIALVDPIEGFLTKVRFARRKEIYPATRLAVVEVDPNLLKAVRQIDEQKGIIPGAGAR